MEKFVADRAEELEVGVMETRKRVLGAEHPDALTSMANLASTYWNQERLQEALGLMSEYVSVQSERLGSGHPDTRASIALMTERLDIGGSHSDET